jgi:alkanesulfonate monooxygenase SsuD/methylene tetrahydromethanopterin reductase-like flavin-dependent oxidoreductase (luciferase family)
MSDHFFASLGRYGGGHERYGSLEPLSTLAALAALTDRVRLGTLVLSAGFRHPAIVAKSATAIDRLSGGRMELGLGAGWFAEEYEAFGFGFADVDERFGRLEETMGYLDALFGDEPASFRGERFRLREAYNHPRPVQEPRPPICRRRVQAPDCWSWSAVRRQLNAAWRWTPGRTGRRPWRLARPAARRRDPARFRPSLGVHGGGEDEADVARAGRRSGGAAPGSLRAARWTRWAEGLAGTPDQVLERLGAFAALGVDELDRPLRRSGSRARSLDARRARRRVLPAARAL